MYETYINLSLKSNKLAAYIQIDLYHENPDIMYTYMI